VTWLAYTFTAGLLFGLTWWAAVGTPTGWGYFLMLAVVAMLVAAAPDFKKGK
jgi:uncharacterized membrane protein YedE/YeeE